MTEATASRRRRRDLERTRTELLDAAADVFARRGFTGASLDEIAEVAGFTRGAVHHHFASKEELFLAIVRRRDEELLAGYGADLLGLMPPDPAASAARWRELHHDGETEVALRLELRSHALRSPALREQLLEADRAAVAATAGRLSEIVAGTALRWRCAVDHLAELLHVASQAASEWAAMTGEDPEAVMRAWLDVIFRGSIDHQSRER